MRAYPSTRERILRARELGIKAGLREECRYTNPYRARCSGFQLWDAWSFGFDESQGAGDMSQFEPGSFDLIDLSAEFRDVIDELDAEMPAAWPDAEMPAAWPDARAVAV